MIRIPTSVALSRSANFSLKLSHYPYLFIIQQLYIGSGVLTLLNIPAVQVLRSSKATAVHTRKFELLFNLLLLLQWI